MSDLIMPAEADGPRVRPLAPTSVSAYVRAEYDKSVHTWGIPNNLIRTMACLPQLGLTEVAYANAFIFDEGTYISWPRPGGKDAADTVSFPAAGFVDRVTKELVINLVSLLNRSRYSITHHSVIGFTTLVSHVEGRTARQRSERAEEMLLHLVDHRGDPDFEDQTYNSKPLYGELHLEALRFALSIWTDAHSVSDAAFASLRKVLRQTAIEQIFDSPLAGQFGNGGPDTAYIDAYVDGMLVELTWCIVHFSGLLNAWFTVLKVRDETDAVRDGIDFVSVYNQVVPERIKVRNNNLLGGDGWGGA